MGAYDAGKFCAHRYDLSTPVGQPDLGVVGGNPGVGANIVSNSPGMGGICAEFNGNNSNYNLGDVAMLNAVTKFTLAFWMNQDILDVGDRAFFKAAGLDGIIIFFSTSLSFYVGNNTRGNYDYSLVVDAGRWHHVACVFDGAGATDADRMKAYIDGNPAPLAFVGAIPAVTPDGTGVDATIGSTVFSFDGRLDDFRIYSRALTQLDVADLMARSRRGATGG